MPERIDTESKTYFLEQLRDMQEEQTSFHEHWQEIADMMLPSKGRISNRGDWQDNRGHKRNENIINNTATKAIRVAVSGLFSGIMNPARPWADLDPPDSDLKKFQPVKEWVELLLKVMFQSFNESNLYIAVPSMLKELLTFGNGALQHDDDFENISRFYTHTIGSYYYGLNDRGDVGTFARRFYPSVRQIATQFGLENATQNVRDDWDRGKYGNTYEVIQMIEPNPRSDPSKALSMFKRWRSVYFQPVDNNKEERQQFLRWKGYNEFPVYCPRWDVAGNDVYATDCPGITALGDVNQLQQQELKKGEAIEKEIDPPLGAPAANVNRQVQGMAGGLTHYDPRMKGMKIEPLYEVSLNLQNLVQDMDRGEERIRTAFFNDLFLAISQIARGIQPKNELELTQRDEERLIQLGPVLWRLQLDFLGRLVSRQIAQILRASIMPPAPPELAGQELNVRFISAMAMSQRAVEKADLERMAGFVGSLAQIPGMENVVDKLDGDELVDEFADLQGVPPTVIVPDEVVSRTRQNRAQQQAAFQQAELQQSQAKTAKLARDAAQL